MDIDQIISDLKRVEVPSEQQIIDLCEKARAIMSTEPCVLRLNAPITLIGDIHG